MPEYTPVYVVTGFLDSGKTSLLNQLLSRRLESGHSLCCIQFEQGEQALEQDLIDRGNLDLLHFPVRKLQSGAGMQQVSKQIYDYLLRNDPEELWIEWNGTLPISVLQTLFPPAKKQDGGTPGDFLNFSACVPWPIPQTGCRSSRPEEWRWNRYPPVMSSSYGIGDLYRSLRTGNGCCGN